MDLIKSFEEACKAENLDPQTALPDVSGSPEQDRIAITSYSRLVIIARVLNKTANDGQEWKPDWSNYDEYKYYPYFEMRGSSGFRFFVYVNWNSRSDVGSRLCFKTRALAEYSAKQFFEDYKQLMVIQ